MKIRLFMRYILPIHLIQLLTSILPNTDITSRIRGALMRPFFKKCGPKFRMGTRNIINRPDQIIIGENVYISHNCYINGTGGLTIEEGCMIGPMSVVVTSKHTHQNGKIQQRSLEQAVTIGAGSWLASHVVISAGVQIGAGTTLAAGAVVVTTIPAHTVAGGVPAKVINQQGKL
ncbi:acyltransferase [Listeria sp. PSOL-1]|uniref:acyltransferase n=1 Tax=Listeria sp. PSOL-1 TaxID=1844999 RepID=UPI0013D3204C|nr:acyltransferase [Listeria sp. PSOL-1]